MKTISFVLAFWIPIGFAEARATSADAARQFSLDCFASLDYSRVCKGDDLWLPTAQ
jgi:hypothetical protein